MKKRLILGLLLGTLGQVSTGNALPTDYRGFYLGVSAGGTETNSSFQSSIVTDFRPNQPLIVPLSYNAKAKSTRPIGCIQLGFSNMIYERTYLGFELSTSYSSGHLKSNQNLSFFVSPAAFLTMSNAIDIKLRNFEFAPDFIPGFLLCDSFLLYARVGAAINRITSTSNGVELSLAPDAHSSLSLVQKKHRIGLRLGLGVSNYISDNLVVNANYIFTYYGNYSTSGAADLIQPAAIIPQGLSTSTKVRLDKQAFMIGLSYYFSTL